jgi:4-carboxymuconolactone decarboxylase
LKSKEEAAKGILETLLGPEQFAKRQTRRTSEKFGAEFSDISLVNVFENLWARPGLGARDRSLVTLGILIALRAEAELEVHIPGAVRNGLTVQELEEVIYHATAYAGFPAARDAKYAGWRALEAAGMLS